MCGITGLISSRRNESGESLERRVSRMASTLAHRGPDGSGVWSDPRHGIALGHRRLAIQDLSPCGAQPMVSACGRYVIVYNGEIYNFRELRSELEDLGRSFRGHSDTEVLLEGIAEWGVEDALRRCDGMWAFAVWDDHRRCLTLARDRLGKKPLYYGWWDGHFLFGSELKALRAHPGFRPALDRDALALFVQLSYIASPRSIYEGVEKLRPGHLISVSPDSIPGAPQKCFWPLRELAERAAHEPLELGDDEAAQILDDKLRNAVARRMISDVPIGAMLSGGFDSSIVVALMQAQSERKVRTFSIGSQDPHLDEARFARAIAAHLGTEHTELVVTEDDAANVIPRLPALYDEPFADPSQLPTFLVCQLARAGVTVALSGDGGDESFAGYNRYFHALDHWRRLSGTPASLRRVGAWALGGLAAGSWLTASRSRASSRNELGPFGRRGASLQKKSERLASRSLADYYVRRDARCQDPRELVIGAGRPLSRVLDENEWPDMPHPLQRLMAIDLLDNLPEHFLVKVDRASMGVSLEVRSPLLDHHIVEWCLRLPISMKVRGAERKWLLRRVLDRYVPRSMTDRPKMGFGIPFDSWVRGSLRDWAEAQLDPRRLRDEGYLDADAVRRVWQQHLSGWRDRRFLIWNLLNFQAWLESLRP